MVGTDYSVTDRASLSHSIQLFLKIYGVADVWSFGNHSSRTYSYFAPVHKTYYHIGSFFIDKRIMNLTTERDYGAIVVYDDKSSNMKWYISTTQSTHYPCRFNPLLLSEEDFTTFISLEIN